MRSRSSYALTGAALLTLPFLTSTATAQMRPQFCRHRPCPDEHSGEPAGAGSMPF